MPITPRDITAEDARATADLMARIEADHPTGFCLAAEEVVELLRDMPGVVMEGAWDGDVLMAYTCVMPQRPNVDGQRFLLMGDVDPRRLVEGLGTLMLDRSLDRARAIHATDSPGRPARYASQALAGRSDQAGLLESAGMEQGRHSFLMVADLTSDVPAPPLPDDVTVTPFDPASADELRAAHNAAFIDYPEGTAIDEDFWGAFMVRAAHARHDVSLVARDSSGEVAGYVFVHEYALPPSGRPGREAYVPYLGTLPRHRGRGLATGLLAQAIGSCRADGYTAASLNVDTENPTGALGIYERAGFREVYRQDFYRLDEPA